MMKTCILLSLIHYIHTTCADKCGSSSSNKFGLLTDSSVSKHETDDVPDVKLAYRDSNGVEQITGWISFENSECNGFDGGWDYHDMFDSYENPWDIIYLRATGTDGVVIGGLKYVGQDENEITRTNFHYNGNAKDCKVEEKNSFWLDGNEEDEKCKYVAIRLCDTKPEVFELSSDTERIDYCTDAPTEEPTLSPTCVSQINDFQIGVQLCDVNGGEYVGQVRHTPWIRNGGGWSSWAGALSYIANPDCVRIGIWGRHNSAVSDDECALKDTDIRFCIQLTDYPYGETGNSRYAGIAKCTPWASTGGGWSDWTGDRDIKDFDSVKIGIETQFQPGLLITDVQAGIRVTDEGTSSYYAGFKEFTEWLIGAQLSTQSWSGWAASKTFIDPDAMRIFLGVTYSMRSSSATAQDKNPIPHDEIHAHSEGGLGGLETHEMIIICVVGLVVIVCIAVTGYGFCKHKNNRNGHAPVYLDDSDDDCSIDELDIVKDIELEGIQQSENKNTTANTM